VGDADGLGHDPERALQEETLQRLPMATAAVAAAMLLALLVSEPSGIPITLPLVVVNLAFILANVGICLAARAGRISLAQAAPAAICGWLGAPLCTVLSLHVAHDQRMNVAFIMELMAAPSIILVRRWLTAGVVVAVAAWIAVDLELGHGSFTPLATFVATAVLLTAIGHVVHANAVVRADAARVEAAAAGHRLVQAQRLEAVGSLAAGLAHDMNNILAGIVGAAESLRSAPPADSPLLLREIIDEAQRGGDLTRALLAFSRKGQYRNEPVDMRSIVDQVVSVLRRTVSKSVVINATHGSDDVIVDGDPAQLTQVVFNLALNGAQAIGEEQQGSVEIRTSFADGTLTVDVADSGAGMDQETRARIFEPFFTTRVGRGSGLGLAMVYGTVLAHKGTIEVASSPGAGTIMRVKLPARLAPARAASVPPEPFSEPVPKPVAEPAPPLHVLLVDDEPLIRSMYERALTRAGMTVTCAEHGGDALARFEAATVPIDAVVLDMAMPVVSGPECFRKLRELKPGLPIVIASGYTVDAEARTLIGSGAATFLEKPFRNETLVNALRALTSAS
jgi:signal transduction histidine kinase/ActR/RegA family two-component response regulator